MLILIDFYSAFIAFGGRVWRACCSRWRLWAFKFGSTKTGFHGVWFEKEVTMKGFLVGKTFPISPLYGDSLVSGKPDNRLFPLVTRISL